MFSERNGDCKTPSQSGLKRSAGTSKLRPQFMKIEKDTPTTQLHHSYSMANIGKSIFSKDLSTPQSTKSRLIRTKTATGPIKLDHNCDTPVRKKFHIEPSCSSQNEVTPPNIYPIRRTSSGTMILRQTPDRVRRQDDEDNDTQIRSKRAGSVSKLEKMETPRKPDDASTPILKRRRTNSASLLPTTPDSKIGLTSPTRRRPREPSITPISPIKKRAKNNSSPRKFVSVASIIMSKGEDTPILSSKVTSTLKRTRSSYTEIPQTEEPKKIVIPDVLKQSTSTETYHSAIEYTMSSSTMEVFLTPRSSFEDSKDEVEEMRPLVKKQISVNEERVTKEKLVEEEPREEEDEGFGDSMRTIKRGQGAMLARSVSLKLSASPKKNAEPSVAETEKASSTPAIPSAPQLQKSSSLSFRFRVSPSTLCLKVDPSTSITTPTTPQTPKTSLATPKKSLLKMTPGVYTPRQGNERRVKKIRFDRLDVYYFERKQGLETVPVKGDITLDMHNQHHTKLQFPLRYGGGRPNLGLEVQNNEDLSDDEVVAPDSDEEEEVEDYRPTAKTLNSLDPLNRIKILENSGVRIEKVESLNRFRNERAKCGCNCKKGICLPATCQCALDGINCQIDGNDEFPCKCKPDKCTNPNGLLYFDAEKVHEFRCRTITNYKASLKTGIEGSPRIKKFVDSDEEEEEKKNLLKYPVTPVYQRRSRSNLSDIRESMNGEINATQGGLTVVEMESLENDVCVEENDVTICPSTPSSSSSLASSNENLSSKIEVSAPIIEQIPNLVVL